MDDRPPIARVEVGTVLHRQVVGPGSVRYEPRAVVSLRGKKAMVDVGDGRDPVPVPVADLERAGWAEVDHRGEVFLVALPPGAADPMPPAHVVLSLPERFSGDDIEAAYREALRATSPLMGGTPHAYALVRAAYRTFDRAAMAAIRRADARRAESEARRVRLEMSRRSGRSWPRHMRSSVVGRFLEVLRAGPGWTTPAAMAAAIHDGLPEQDLSPNPLKLARDVAKWLEGQGYVQTRGEHYGHWRLTKLGRTGSNPGMTGTKGWHIVDLGHGADDQEG